MVPFFFNCCFYFPIRLISRETDPVALGEAGSQGDRTMSVRESFNPESYELDKSFRLTRFTELKGTGCKVPQDVLQKLLESLQENHFQEDEQFLGAVMPRLGK